MASADNPLKRSNADSHRGQRGFACEPCSKRKVRCNRQSPCTNCSRRGEDCVYAVSSEVFEQRQQRRDELRRKKVKSDDGASQPTPPPPPATTTTTTTTTAPDPGQTWEGTPSASLPNPSSLLFGSDSQANALVVWSYPSPARMQALWKLYMQNVHPVITLFPVWKLDEILAQSLDRGLAVPHVVHALQFAMCTMTIWTVSETACLELMNERRLVLLDRYQACTERALSAAQFLQNNDILIIHAFFIYLVSISDRADIVVTWTLMGLLIRMAERQQLHKDPATRNLSGWDVEYQRRLWHEIKKLNRRLSELCGPLGLSLRGDDDTQIPSGIDNNQMRPDMAITNLGDVVVDDCLLTMVRTELSVWEATLRSPVDTHRGMRWFNWTRETAIPLQEKELIIQNLETRLQNQYLAFCDPLKASHYLAGIIGRAALVVLRLCAYYFHGHLGSNNVHTADGDKRDPAQYAQRALRYHLLSVTMPIVEPFKWHCKYQFQWHALFVLLLEMRNRPGGPEVESYWQLIADIVDAHPEMTFHMNKSMHAAAGDLMLQAWRSFKALGTSLLFGGQDPAFIKAIEQARQLFAEQALAHPAAAGPYSSLMASSDEQDVAASAPNPFASGVDASFEWNMWDFVPFEDFDFDWQGLDLSAANDYSI